MGDFFAQGCRQGIERPSKQNYDLKTAIYITLVYITAVNSHINQALMFKLAYSNHTLILAYSCHASIWNIDAMYQINL